MSSGRANASAVQRRTSNSKPSSVQPPSRGNYQQVHQGPQGPQGPSYQQGSSQQSVRPKLSVSDAIALITIRLGRVETFINDLPPLDQLEGMYSSNCQQPSSHDNLKVVDEAVFTSIVSRLDKLEQYNVEKDKENEKKLLLKERSDLDKDRHLTKQLEDLNQLIKRDNSPQLEKTIDDLKYQVRDLQSLLMNLQNYVMTMNVSKQVSSHDIMNSNDDDLQMSIQICNLLSQKDNIIGEVFSIDEENIIEEDKEHETTNKDDDHHLSINI